MSKRQEKKKFTFAEKLALVWFLIDAFTHLSIELGYVYLAFTTTAQKTDNYLGHIWREYGRADARWAIRDPVVMSIELATVFVGLLCLLMVYGVIYRSGWRHPLQIIICVCELYGGWMTFAPEWIDGSPNLNGSDPILLWIYLVFMNGLWVVIPLLLLWDSFARLTEAANKSSYPVDTGYPPLSPSNFCFILGALSIVLYMILVPAVLFSAKGVPVSL
eukprot:gene15624-17522_t